MQTFLSTLCFLPVLICVKMKGKAEIFYTGIEGGSVEIYCKYPDGYQYTPMYFCHDPCGYFDVLIKSEKVDTVVSKGRYIAVNTVSAQSFSVTIKNLTLKDSGVYYCGVNTWGTDKLTNINLTVSKVHKIFPAVSTLAPVTGEIQMSEVTKLPIPTRALSPAGKMLIACAGMLGLMLCCVLTSLVILHMKTSYEGNSCLWHVPENQIPQPNQEDMWPVYNAVLAANSTAGPNIGDDLNSPCSTFRHPAPADNDCRPYSLGAPY